jgi:hypothetical protein
MGFDAEAVYPVGNDDLDTLHHEGAQGEVGGYGYDVRVAGTKTLNAP